MFLARIGEKNSTRIDRTWLLAADVMFHCICSAPHKVTSRWFSARIPK
jgi:hypothetical protein